MKPRLLYDAGAQRTFALVFSEGEEVKSGILQFAKEQGVNAASFTGIGAFRDVTFSYFDVDEKEYIPRRLSEQVELLVLAGNIAQASDGPRVHAHVVVAKRDGTAHGGDLAAAIVRPTVEVVLTESPGHLRREVDERTGLPLIV